MLGITRLRLLRVGRGNGADFSAPAALETIEAEQPKPPLHTHREGARRHGLLHVQLGQTLQLHLMASQASTSLGRFYTPHAQQVFAGREEPQSHSKEAETTPARLCHEEQRRLRDPAGCSETHFLHPFAWRPS